MKKALSLILAGLLLLLSITGCSQKSKLDPDDPVTLTMWHVYGSQTESPLDDSINEFNRTVAIYVASSIVAFAMLLLLLLSVFGVLNPINGRIDEYLDDQLINHTAQIEHDVDKLAAYSVSFSKQMEMLIAEYLTDNQMTFDELTNDIDALTALQSMAYHTVYTNIQVASCSGAFYILDATVNDTLEVPHYNGIYIKFANLYAESTINTKVSLFRGSADVARANNINLFSTWQNEMLTDAFEDTSVYANNAYFLSSVEDLPDSWEQARYIYTPIYGNDSQVIGICGLELSDLFVQLSYNTADTESAQTICALFDKTDSGYKGQFISNRSGYVPPECEIITVTQEGSFYEYRCGENAFIGKEKEIVIDGNTLTVAIMLPKPQYESIVRNGQLKNILIFFIIAMTALCSCLWLSKKYISPIRKSIDAFKASKEDYTPSGIVEIDDLFVFLAEQDRKNEAVLAEMEKEKAQIQSTLDQISTEHNKAQQKIAQFAYSRKNEVDPYDYEQFLMGLKTLTHMERVVFNYYLDGKGVKDIVELVGVKESTIRFHNRNIYSKLGVNSLKRLLMFAAIMKQDEEGGDV